MPCFCQQGLAFGLRFRKLRNLLCKVQTVASVSGLGTFLNSVDEGRRLRLRCWDALRRRLQGGVSSNKKGQWLNHLKWLNPKRQIQTVNRQECAIYRQKVLAVLSCVCQCSDCSVTKAEVENDRPRASRGGLPKVLEAEPHLGKA